MRELVHMPTRGLFLAALLIAAVAVPAEPAAASPTQASLLQDDPQLIYSGSSTRTKRLNEIQSLGVDIVKVRVNWRYLAPKHRPSRFDGANPASYGSRWAPFDEVVSGGVPQSPRIYRGLLNAAAAGLQASGHGSDQLLVGELLPFTRTASKSSKKVRPIAFLRELACVDSHYRPYRGKAARKRGCAGFKSIPGTGLAYHPYTLAGGPNVKTPNHDDASIGNLGRLTKAISRLRSKGRIRSSWPIWITEFGFQSRPPDPYATPIKKIPGFMGESEWLAYKNRRVVAYGQYPLVDDAGTVAGFQSGLRFHNGKKKPGVFAAFQRPFFARHAGSRVELFGGVRAAGGGSVTLQTRTKKSKWTTLRNASLNSRGYFDVRVKVSRVSKRYFRFIGAGQPASRSAKALKR